MARLPTCTNHEKEIRRLSSSQLEDQGNEHKDTEAKGPNAI